MITDAETRELATIMNRSKVSRQFGSLVVTCKRVEDFERAYELLAKQGRDPERNEARRTLICRA